MLLQPALKDPYLADERQSIASQESLPRNLRQKMNHLRKPLAKSELHRTALLVKNLQAVSKASSVSPNSEKDLERTVLCIVK